MKNNKKISVLTSIYKAAKFLPGYFKALSEIRGKEMIEVLLLHNEPKEEELSVIRQHLPSMDFIRHIIIPERESLYRTWNRGILLAEGEYITVWNVDDIRFPNSILQQAEALDKHPEAAIAYGKMYITDTYGKNGTIMTDPPLYNYKNEFFKAYNMSCFQMWRKSIHQSVGYYDEQFKCSADFDFQIRTAIHFPFVRTEEPLGSFLDYHTHKLSLNGLQELENNIIYSRYGVYENINPFCINSSKKKYRKGQLLYDSQWVDLQEKSPFGMFSGIKSAGLLLVKTPYFLLKITVKKLLQRIDNKEKMFSQYLELKENLPLYTEDYSDFDAKNTLFGQIKRVYLLGTALGFYRENKQLESFAKKLGLKIPGIYRIIDRLKLGILLRNGIFGYSLVKNKLWSGCCCYKTNYE
jgi:hypothetical protein